MPDPKGNPTAAELAQQEQEVRERLDKARAKARVTADAKAAAAAAEAAAEAERKEAEANKPLTGFVPVGTVMADAELLLRTGRNVFLHGPPASGKSQMAHELRKVFGIEDHGPEQGFFEMTGGKMMDPATIIGRRGLRDGNTTDEPGIIAMACESSHERPTLLFLDELNAFPEASQTLLNYLCDWRRTVFEPSVMQRPMVAASPVDEQRQPTGKGLMILAAANIGSQYMGRGKISPDLATRFAGLEVVPPDAETMRRLLIGRGLAAPKAATLADFIARVNQRSDKCIPMGMRQANAICDAHLAGMAMAKAAKAEATMLSLDNKSDYDALQECIRVVLGSI